jgi:hypothetical protein
MHGKPYLRLAVMTALSFAAMYVLMYAMVNTLPNVKPNLNQLYMAGLMAAAMVVIELVVMWPMYGARRRNAVVLAASVVALAGFWFGIRDQTAVGDREFLKSMIPHHAGAILMCEKARLQDAEIRELCSSIISSQQAEIDQMKGLLAKGG